jgi:hypothetical protein
MQAEYAKMNLALGDVFESSGLTSYVVPTHDTVMKSYQSQMQALAHMKKAGEAARLQTEKEANFCMHQMGMFYVPRAMSLAVFSWDEVYGKGGELAREANNKYDFDKHHHVNKSAGVGADLFVNGFVSLPLLLHYGDLSSARVGWIKVLDAHKHIKEQAEACKTALEAHVGDVWNACHLIAFGLLAAGEMGLLKSFMARNMGSLALRDEAAKEAMSFFYKNRNDWRSPTGHMHSTLASWLLMVQALQMMTEEDTKASRKVLAAWLPPLSTLQRIVEFETAFRIQSFGSCHPSLLCASLNGERLGAWDVAEAVASKLLEVEEFNPLCRVEAGRLLCRARASLGRREGACEAASRAADEAARTGLWWLEMLALRDWLRYGGAEAGSSVWSRLEGVMGRLMAPNEELMEVLGEDIRRGWEANTARNHSGD